MCLYRCPRAQGEVKESLTALTSRHDGEGGGEAEETDDQGDVWGDRPSGGNDESSVATSTGESVRGMRTFKGVLPLDGCVSIRVYPNRYPSELFPCLNIRFRALSPFLLFSSSQGCLYKCSLDTMCLFGLLLDGSCSGSASPTPHHSMTLKAAFVTTRQKLRTLKTPPT